MLLFLCIVQIRYTWQIYSERLLTLTGVYGFWKHVSKLDRRESRRYLEMFHALKYRKLVIIIPISFISPVSLLIIWFQLEVSTNYIVTVL